MTRTVYLSIPLIFFLVVPVFGRDFEIKMLRDGSKYVYSPSELTIHHGDRVTFVLVSGAPHTVTFYPEKAPGKNKAEKAKLAQRLTYKKHYGFLSDPGASYTILFNKEPAGKYEYYCRPHEAMGMKGVIYVKK